MKIDYELDDMVGTYKSSLDGEEHEYQSNENMLAVLLANEVVWVREASVTINKGTPYEASHENGTMLFVACNDVFAWGCADGEALSEDQIKPLFLAWHKDNGCGPAIWACKFRKEKPQAPVAKMLKERGLWDEELEALPENRYDAAMRERKAREQAGKTA